MSGSISCEHFVMKISPVVASLNVVVNRTLLFARNYADANDKANLISCSFCSNI